MEQQDRLTGLRNALSLFEQAIIEAVTQELKRIGCTVPMDDLDFIPFREDVQDYIEAIRLDEDGIPTLDVSFSDISEKTLAACIAANEIDHWDMVALVELLVSIEVIPHEEGDADAWVCLCGHTPGAQVFFSCDYRGTEIEPIAGVWEDLYRCAYCGRIIEGSTRRVIRHVPFNNG